MTGKRTMTPDDWREAEAMAKRGANYKQIAQHFGTSHGSVRQRASVKDWQTPDRIARKERLVGRLARQGGGEGSPEINTEERGGRRTLAALGVDQTALLAAVERGPQEFSRELTRAAQLAIAEGVASIPPPRTIREVKTLVDMLYKLDAKGSGSDTRVIRSASSLTRSVVEVEVVPNNSVDEFAI